MDKITTYRKILLQFLSEYKTYWSGSKDPLKYRIIIDSEQNTYQMLRIGWDGDDYYHDCIYHFDIIDGKVWIQKNETDRLIAQELVSMGIPKHDIVLGLLPPIMRKDSEYAAA